MSYASYARFQEPAYVSAPEPDIDSFEFETSAIDLVTPDGPLLGETPDARLSCEWKAGRIVITGIEIKRLTRTCPIYSQVDNRRDPLSVEVCAAIRRHYATESGQKLLRSEWDDACELARFA